MKIPTFFPSRPRYLPPGPKNLRKLRPNSGTLSTRPHFDCHNLPVQCFPRCVSPYSSTSLCSLRGGGGTEPSGRWQSSLIRTLTPPSSVDLVEPPGVRTRRLAGQMLSSAPARLLCESLDRAALWIAPRRQLATATYRTSTRTGPCLGDARPLSFWPSISLRWRTALIVAAVEEDPADRLSRRMFEEGLSSYGAVGRPGLSMSKGSETFFLLVG